MLLTENALLHIYMAHSYSDHIASLVDLLTFCAQARYLLPLSTDSKHTNFSHTHWCSHLAARSGARPIHSEQKTVAGAGAYNIVYNIF